VATAVFLEGADRDHAVGGIRGGKFKVEAGLEHEPDGEEVDARLRPTARSSTGSGRRRQGNDGDAIAERRAALVEHELHARRKSAAVKIVRAMGDRHAPV